MTLHSHNPMSASFSQFASKDGLHLSITTAGAATIISSLAGYVSPRSVTMRRVIPSRLGTGVRWQTATMHLQGASSILPGGENSVRYAAGVEEPHPIGDSLEELLRHPLPERLKTLREKILQEHEANIAALKERAVQAYGGMLLQEIEYLVLCGWRKEKALLPAVNNLGVKKREMQDELVAGVEQLRQALCRKLRTLLEDNQ